MIVVAWYGQGASLRLLHERWKAGVFIQYACGPSMTYRYEIDRERKLVTAIIEGDVTPDDFAGLLRAYRTDPAFEPGYARLWDGRGIRSLAADAPGLLRLAAVIREMQPDPIPARIAVVVSLNVYYDAGLYVRLMARMAETRLFHSMETAYQWLRVVPHAGPAPSADAPRHDRAT